MPAAQCALDAFAQDQLRPALAAPSGSVPAPRRPAHPGSVLGAELSVREASGFAVLDPGGLGHWRRFVSV